MDPSSPFYAAGQGEASPPSLPVSISSPSLQSRMVRNETPYLIWTTRRDVLDCRFLSKDQMINHYARAGSFTTKVGIPGSPGEAPAPAGLVSRRRLFRENADVLRFTSSSQTPSDTCCHDCVLISHGICQEQRGPGFLDRAHLSAGFIEFSWGFLVSSSTSPSLHFLM